MTDKVEVRQVDIEAANAFLRDCPLSVKMVLGARPSIIKNAFARHRLAAEASARKIALEEAAGVAESHYLSRPDDDHQLGQSHAAETIATAIRDLSTGGEE